MFERKHEVKLNLIDFDDINEETLELIKKQFDLIVSEFKSRDNAANYFQNINTQHEFDERDEIIQEKDEMIKKLRESIDVGDLSTQSFTKYIDS